MQTHLKPFLSLSARLLVIMVMVVVVTVVIVGQDGGDGESVIEVVCATMVVGNTSRS